MNLSAPFGYSTYMRYLLLLGLAFALDVAAQHCAFDFARIIVVHPHLEGDTNVIAGLRVMLLDKENLPATSTGTPYYLFQRNTDRPTKWMHSSHWHRNGRRQFPFAQDNYVLVIPEHFALQDYRILVLDERPIPERERLRAQFFHLDPSDSYRLCSRYNAEVYPTDEGASPFHAIDVSLFHL